MFKKNISISILLILFFSVFFLFSPEGVFAGEDDFKPQVDIGVKNLNIKDGGLMGRYIEGIYKYSIGFVGILAAVVLMFGGFLWITAAGNGERVANAKAWIQAALSGLVLALCSYTILWYVNPDLVKFESIDIKDPIKSDEISAEIVGCCEWVSPAQALLKTEEDCTKLKGDWKGPNFAIDNDLGSCIELKCCLTENFASGSGKSCNMMSEYACEQKGGTSKAGSCLNNSCTSTTIETEGDGFVIE